MDKPLLTRCYTTRNTHLLSLFATIDGTQAGGRSSGEEGAREADVRRQIMQLQKEHILVLREELRQMKNENGSLVLHIGMINCPAPAILTLPAMSMSPAALDHEFVVNFEYGVCEFHTHLVLPMIAQVQSENADLRVSQERLLNDSHQGVGLVRDLVEEVQRERDEALLQLQAARRQVSELERQLLARTSYDSLFVAGKQDITTTIPQACSSPQQVQTDTTEVA